MVTPTDVQHLQRVEAAAALLVTMLEVVASTEAACSDRKSFTEMQAHAARLLELAHAQHTAARTQAVESRPI